jgi:D-glycero-alpha-D-manno-heptose-7-phosphate kinase
MIAVVLAGGLGTRLQTAIPDLPKCMSPVAGRPFLEHVLEWLRRQDVTRVVLAIGYRGDHIRRHFGNGADRGLELLYSDDGSEQRGTGGALARALSRVPGPPDEPVLVLNGDTYVEFDVAALAEKHAATGARLVLAAAQVPDTTRYGRLELGDNGAVRSFGDKRSGPGVIHAGVYWGRRRDFAAVLAEREASSFEHDVLPPLAGSGLYAVIGAGTFVDIGVPEDLRRAEALVPPRPSIPVIVRARAPLRISFAGGGSDVSPYCDEYGGAVLSATFNKYVHVALIPTEDGRVGLHSLDYQTSVHYDATDALPLDGRLDLIKACINHLCLARTAGFEVRVHSDAPPGSGVGASSALVVAVLAAFREWQRLPLSEHELAETAFRVERCDLGIAGGRQDQYAAAYGGFNFMEFSAAAVIVTPLPIRSSVINELEERLVLAYTGGSRVSAGIIADQVRRYTAQEPDALDAMHELKALAIAARGALLSGDVGAFGEITHRGWETKKRLSEKISNPALDDLYDRARAAGAIGGKVSGAGGGGYMFFVTHYDARKDVVDALRAGACQVVDFSFERAGAAAWRLASAGRVA